MADERLTLANFAAIYQIADQNWQAAVGDFDGDGKSDVLWFNQQTDTMVMLFMNGLNYSNA